MWEGHRLDRTPVSKKDAERNLIDAAPDALAALRTYLPLGSESSVFRRSCVPASWARQGRRRFDRLSAELDLDPGPGTALVSRAESSLVDRWRLRTDECRDCLAVAQQEAAFQPNLTTAGSSRRHGVWRRPTEDAATGHTVTDRGRCPDQGRRFSASRPEARAGR